MEYNPEAIEDKQTVYTDQQTTVVRQPLAGGAGGVYTGTKNEEKDPESQLHGTVTAPPRHTTMETTTTTTAVPPPVAVATTRQTVRPSPRHDGPSKYENRDEHRTGFLSAFTTKSRGRFFFPLHAAIVLFSFLVLVASSRAENTGLNVADFTQYAIAIANVSFAVSLAACVMERLGLLENHHIRVALSAFQLFFWIPALVLITFFGLFASPLLSANGFFGAWGALIAAALAFSHETDRSQRIGDHRAGDHRAGDRRSTSAPRTSLVVVFFVSLMVMGSAIQVYNFQRNLENEFGPEAPWSYVVFAIAFGAITAFLAVMFLLTLEMMTPTLMFIFGVILWLWIAVGTPFLTFGAPFEQALSNGYYSCLFLLLASFGLLASLHYVDKKESDRARDNRNNTNNAATTTGAAAGTTTTTAGATTTTREGEHRRDSNNHKRIHDTSRTFFLFVCGGTYSSLMVMIAASLLCRDSDGCPGSYARWEVAAGAVSLGLGLLVIVLSLFMLHKIPTSLKIIFSAIWLAWWIASFITITYIGDFSTPVIGQSSYANGFFFTWAALVFAALAFSEGLKEAARNRDPPSPLVAKLGLLLLVIGGSLIELGAAIDAWYGSPAEAGENSGFSMTVYALALGSVSIFLVIVLFFVLLGSRQKYERHDALYNIGFYFLTLWWALGALILTFNGLWSSAFNNGYFSVYFTLGTCLLALSGFWRTEDEYDDLHRNEGRDEYRATGERDERADHAYRAA
jgi:hypothetical protein